MLGNLWHNLKVFFGWRVVWKTEHIEPNLDLDAIHFYQPINVDDEGFCVCHGYDCVYKGRPKRNIYD